MTNDNQQRNSLSAEALLDDLINDLNQGQWLETDMSATDTREMPEDAYEASDEGTNKTTKDVPDEVKELQAIAQILKKGSSSIQEPSEDFVANLWQKLEPFENGQGKKHQASSLGANNNPSRNPSLLPVKKKLLPWAGLVASILVVLFLFSTWSGSSQNIVLAMEGSVKKLENYHGILEKISINDAGERQFQIRTEIWSVGEKYATQNQDGFLTVNNGEIRWRTNSSTKEISLLPIYADPHDFDLQNEAAKALSYPHKILGKETIAGRAATHIEIQPPGGLPYSLWIDQETHLPIQLQTAMQKSLQTTYTYISLETNTTIPEDIFTYNPLPDYRVVDNRNDLLVASLEEAIRISSLAPLELSATPRRIFAAPQRIVFDFEDTIIIQTKATGALDIDPQAALGQAEDGPLEILSNSLRWQQKDLEIQVQGKRFKELAQQLTDTLDLTPQAKPLPPEETINKVPIDLEVVKNNQQQVDSGSSPWQLDPVQVAFTFIALQISPEGIVGEPPLDYDTLRMTENDGKRAVIQASEGPVRTVYLERLIRQDETGIWTVTGYLAR
ncbi:MAG: outer membrane lipoprotein carrier protein LolA [Desulfitobacterium sp.]